MKRVFDIFFSLIGIVLLFPLFLIIALWIKSDSKGPVFYKQSRVGLNNRNFSIFKFRTMYLDSDKKGLLTVGDTDPRITASGLLLRKTKIDELPQLINVFIGEMSFVGPRPEVKKYVDLYSAEQKKVLTVRPGVTDLASIVYRNEAELLKNSPDPEKRYIEEIMVDKLNINLSYLKDRSLLTDIGVIFKTFLAILN